MHRFTRITLVAAAMLIVVALGLRMHSTFFRNDGGSPEREPEYQQFEGTWERYDGQSPQYDYMIRSGDRRIPFVLAGGERYIGRQVRVTVELIDGGPQFRIVTIDEL